MIKRTSKDKNHPFVLVDKGFLNNNKLSLKAKGLLTLMLSHPDDWSFYMENISEMSSDGKASHVSAMKNLIEQGYIEKQQARTGGKFCGVIYTVIENPKSNNKIISPEEYLASCITNSGNITLTRMKKDICNYGEDAFAEKAKCLTYKSFLKTAYWRIIVNFIHKKHNNTCQICKAKGKPMAVHHKKYDNHGYEHLHVEDLTLLCKDCHRVVHEK